MSLEITLDTIFRWCNDVSAMRAFYTDLLGLSETFFRDDEHGWLTYQIGAIQLVFTRSDTTIPTYQEFAQNPAYQGGSIKAESWVYKLPSDVFTAVVERLQTANVPTYWNTPKQTRDNHQQFYILDPMGYTIEIYAEFSQQA